MLLVEGEDNVFPVLLLVVVLFDELFFSPGVLLLLSVKVNIRLPSLAVPPRNIIKKQLIIMQ